MVTLGGQSAHSIAVLPSMDGIIATFEPVDQPVAVSGEKWVELPLTVWTSEGESTAKQKVCVHTDADAAHSGD